METMNTMKTTPRNIILDVSALTTEEGYSIVKNADKVYLTPGTIDEMVSCKSARTHANDFVWRVRDVLRESAKDTEAQKYVCIFIEPDEKVYAKDIFTLGKRDDIDAVILTSNYGVCNHAKAHRIPYMLITVSEPMTYNDDKQEEQLLEKVPEEIVEEVLKEEEEVSDIIIPDEGRNVVTENGYYEPLSKSDYIITDYRGKEQNRPTNKLNQADYVTEKVHDTIYCYRIYQDGLTYNSKLLEASEDKKFFISSQQLPRKLAETIEARF